MQSADERRSTTPLILLRAVLTASQGFGGTEKKRGVGQLCRQLYLDWKDRAVDDLWVTLTRKASALAVLSTSSLYSLEVSQDSNS